MEQPAEALSSKPDNIYELDEDGLESLLDEFLSDPSFDVMVSQP